MRKYLITLLALSILLASATGCPKKVLKAHLTAYIGDYTYNPSTGFIEVYIKVVNNGEIYVDYYHVTYRISYDSKYSDFYKEGSGIKVGQTHTLSRGTFIPQDKTFKSVTVLSVTWTVL